MTSFTEKSSSMLLGQTKGEFVLLPCNLELRECNFTLISELKERSEFSKVKHPLNLLNMQEGDMRSAIYIVKSKDFVEDILEFVTDLHSELEKDFHRMEYYHGKKKIKTLAELREIVENNEEDEKKLIQVMALASCLGLPISIVSRGLEYPLYLAEMSSIDGTKKIAYPMKTTIQFDNQKKKWNIQVTKSIRCCTATEPSELSSSNKEKHKIYGTSYGICTLELNRKAEDPTKVQIHIDILRIPPIYGETHALLDLHPSISFSHQ